MALQRHPEYQKDHAIWNKFNDEMMVFLELERRTELMSEETSKHYKEVESMLYQVRDDLEIKWDVEPWIVAYLTLDNKEKISYKGDAITVLKLINKDRKLIKEVFENNREFSIQKDGEETLWSDDSLDGKYIYLKVDISRNKTEIITEIDEILEKHYKHVPKHILPSTPKSSKKKEKDLSIWEIWDRCKDQKRLNFSEISWDLINERRDIYNDSHHPNLSQQVGRAYKKACKIIDLIKPLT